MSGHAERGPAEMEVDRAREHRSDDGWGQFMRSHGCGGAASEQGRVAIVSPAHEICMRFALKLER